MRLPFVIAVLAMVAVVVNSQGLHSPSPFIPVGANRRPTNNNRRTVAGGNSQDQATRLGLLANQIGLNPVPGGIQSGGSPVSGAFQVVPGGSLGLSRDDGCWCQPINQECTALRPANLDLVTRIINKPGSPGSPGRPTAGCTRDQRLCCNNPSGGPLAGVTVAPITSGPLVQLGTCGARNPVFGSAVSPTADLGEYPWMAVIMGPGYQYVSGGVLLSDSWVLTAAHKLQSAQGLTVRLGDYDVGDPNDVPHFEVPVSQVIIHPQFNRQNLANDIALLRLSQPVPFRQFAFISPACLPAQAQVFEGQRCFVSGWGKNAFQTGNHQRKLQEVDVPVVNSFRCQNLLRNTRLGPTFVLDQKSFICAGGELNKDACGGDGGSPLVCGSPNGRWTVAGLVAWGVGCGRLNVPAAYVNVATYANFIRQYVGNV